VPTQSGLDRGNLQVLGYPIEGPEDRGSYNLPDLSRHRAGYSLPRDAPSSRKNEPLKGVAGSMEEKKALPKEGTPFINRKALLCAK